MSFKEELLDKLKEIDQKNQDQPSQEESTTQKPKRDKFVPPPRPPGMFTDEEWKHYLGWKKRLTTRPQKGKRKCLNFQIEKF